MEVRSAQPGPVPSGTAALADRWDVEPELFASLARNDQRRMAEQYVRGLLAAEGRKTLRNVAEQIGGKALQQSVHHFITASSWNWAPVRGALARLADEVVRPQAWVVNSTVIPKAGIHSVGVDQQFLPHLGQTVNGQRAFSAWSASERISVPFNWSLVLSRNWLEDPARRSRAHIPDASRVASLEEHAGSVALEAAEAWGLRRRPVVVDVEGLDAGATVGRFARAGASLILRVDGATPLRVDGSLLQGYSDKEVPALSLISSMKRMRRQVEWSDVSGNGMHFGVVSAIPVLLACPAPGSGPGGGPSAVHHRPMLLIGDWRSSGRWPSRLWLTDSRRLPLITLLRLTRLTDVVERDFAEISEHTGVRDFAGRSFQGWHRHITLASVAHLVAARAGTRCFPARRRRVTGSVTPLCA
ncbi:IS701 family transposase [Streptomyces roseoverticillatus]|uniref:Transposase n=1 Tax=Streptomyces roseoverticillatus TaxID=66429 RepID=A0ABV3IMT0_9ACTN